MKNDNDLYLILQKDIKEIAKPERDKLFNAGLIGNDGQAVKKNVWKLYKRLRVQGVIK